MAGNEIHPFFTNLAPAPGGHYSQGIVCGGLLFVSGQLPIRPDGLHLSTAPFDHQCRLALTNLFEILTAAGTSPNRVLKVTAYIAAATHWAALNAVFADMFGSHRPARSVIPVKELHYGYLVEIDAIAALPQR